MTIATTTFLKLNQSHFSQTGIDYQQSGSASDANDFYQHHHFPYHAFMSHHQYYPPHMHCTPPSQHCDHHGYGTTSNSSGKSFAHHTYQTIGPSTISSTLFHDQHHYAKPDNMGNIEIIETKKPRAYDEMNNEI
jgi:hypothetical protein